MSADLVSRIKSELQARGVSLDGNEGSFQITGRVAFALRGQGAKLIVKRPEQNGALWRGVKYSHDAIALPGGWIDCLQSAGPPDNMNIPVWNGTGTDTSAQLADPFDMDAAPAANVQTSLKQQQPSGGPAGGDDQLLLANQRLVELFGKLDGQHKELLDRIDKLERAIVNALPKAP